ncbi:MAG: alpha-mannosidase [Anaerolineae bacterium]|nr:alpha-mannosidase [Anaerolineae bacterium]
MKHPNTYRHDIRSTADKIASRLKLVHECIYPQRLPLTVYVGRGDVSDPAQVDDWTIIKPGEMWGGQNEERWFRCEVTIPPEWAGSRVGVYFALGHPSWRAQPEALAYLDGQFYQGIDGNHHEILLAERAPGGETRTITLHAWCTMFDEDTTALYQQIFWIADLVQIDRPTRHFYHSAEVALETARLIDPDQHEHHLILNALEDAFIALDLREPRSPQFYESVAKAEAILDEGLAKSNPLPATVLATGHAHIDVLWRWLLYHTRAKTMHSFANVVRLMEQYPSFHFIQSQPQLYWLLKRDAPDLYEQIKALVKAGRWEITGGMWVEADCNIPSGESLVRQILLGRLFFREEFGIESDVLWLPDTFGYSWALPQIIKRSGMKYFMTSKISWNDTNRLPYDSFWWRGIDGTEVLTHFLTAPGDPQFGGSTYNAMLKPHDVLGAWQQYQQKDRHAEVLTAFGWGDGGGGPTLEMLERAERMRNQPGLPRVEQGSASGFFERLAADGKKLPTWNGELYLEYHRGTYTTQARSKRANRKAEALYHRAELAAAIATLVGKPYPHERLNEGWRLILLNQFHDVIPGSSIGEVYAESMKDYERVFEIGESVLRESIDAIAEHLPLAEGERGLVLLHTSGSSRWNDPVVPIPAEWLPEGYIVESVADGKTQAIQPSHDASTLLMRTDGFMNCTELRVLRFKPSDDKADPTNREANESRHARHSGTPLAIPVSAEAPEPQGLLRRTNQPHPLPILENIYLKVQFNELGEIVSLYDKQSNREIIPTGAVGNQLQAFEDRPAKWDAWDIDLGYGDKMWTAEPESITVIENGPLRATIEVRKKILNSSVIQRIALVQDSQCLDFHTTIDWRERHVLLKVAFPVNILSPLANFGIQFGSVQRPTHHNTSWDWARFESVAHGWASLAESDYGVSLLSDSKYGYDVHDNVLRLSLLRAPTFPDPEADQGQHEFIYSLLPHRSGMENGGSADDLNNPIIAFPIQGKGGTRFLAEQPLITAYHNVVIETVKGAEDGRGIIVRLYEAARSRGEITLRCGFPIAQAWETNLMEDDEQELAVIGGNTLNLYVMPFQIRTIRLIPA